MSQTPKNASPTTILNVLVKMSKKGRSDDYIKFTDKALIRISKHADLNNPEQVLNWLTNLETSNHYKRNVASAYNEYLRFYKIDFTMPSYKADDKLPKIPTTEKVEMLIARCAGRVLSTKLQLSKETGLRPIELHNLKVKDVDLEQKLVYPATAKNGRARVLPISNKLAIRIQDHIIRGNLNPTDQLFKGTADHYGKIYRSMRSRLAKKLKDPTIKTIRLYDFRHYFASKLYEKTKDILYVKQQLGHKRLETTLKYTQLLNVEDDDWTCKVAHNIEQDKKLIEAGFEFVTERNGLKIYRKRK